jgi:hypothetical protein
MLQLQQFIGVEDLTFRNATPEDARSIAQLYAEVYRGEYPFPELFTEKGMADFLAFEKSHAMTRLFSFEGTIVGCLTAQLKGRALYSRGGMVAPEYRGHISSRLAFQHVLRLQQHLFYKNADYFYGEARTETAKFHAIFEELCWRPWAILPRKDVFFGRRESEVIYVYYFSEPRVGTLDLTPAAARVASAVLNRIILPSEKGANMPKLPKSSGKVDSSYEVHSPGEAIVTISVLGASVIADACPASRCVERVIINARNDVSYGVAARAFIEYLRVLGMEYAEIYVPARSGARQAILESLGFQPTGFLPAWHSPGVKRPATSLVYTISFPSSLPDCPVALTKYGEYLRDLISPNASVMNHAITQAQLASAGPILSKEGA